MKFLEGSLSLSHGFEEVFIYLNEGSDIIVVLFCLKCKGTVNRDSAKKHGQGGSTHTAIVRRLTTKCNGVTVALSFNWQSLPESANDSHT